MNLGKTLFSQLMDCLPWSTFMRIVARYHGDHSVQTFPCTEQYRAMAFAQLTYRESLRDIEACLSAQPTKLWHMGFGGPVRRSTLADANEARNWRIYEEFAQRLIAQARRLYVGESLLGDLDNTVYAWIRPPSTCACRCSHGRISDPPRPPLRYTRCWICAAISRVSSLSRTESCTMCMRLIGWCQRLAPSMSWTEATSISAVCMDCTRPAPFS